MAKSAQSIELDATERLEEKVRKLVALVEEMRGERVRSRPNRTSAIAWAGCARSWSIWLARSGRSGRCATSALQVRSRSRTCSRKIGAA
jgi:hypothetical protein